MDESSVPPVVRDMEAAYVAGGITARKKAAQTLVVAPVARSRSRAVRRFCPFPPERIEADPVVGTAVSPEGMAGESSLASRRF